MKYTLDRIEDDFYVFLKYPNEDEVIEIATSVLNSDIQEGDIVLIEQDDEAINIKVLNEETESLKSQVADLLKKLQNK